MPSLPREHLVERLERELAEAHKNGPHFLARPIEGVSEFPLVLRGRLLDAPGPLWDGKALVHEYVHKFELTVTEEYPYVRPSVKWLTPIFHPNIMMPDEGGLVCTRLLDEWNFDDTLAEYLVQLAKLVREPDTANAFATPASSAAAQYFKKAPYKPPASALDAAE